MKLEVLRSDGRSEVLDLVGPCEFYEARDGGAGHVYCPAMFMRYFFSADGRYDGWEAEVNFPYHPDGPMPPKEVAQFVAEVEKGRDIRERE